MSRDEKILWEGKPALEKLIYTTKVKIIVGILCGIGVILFIFGLYGYILCWIIRDPSHILYFLLWFAISMLFLISPGIPPIFFTDVYNSEYYVTNFSIYRINLPEVYTQSLEYLKNVVIKPRKKIDQAIKHFNFEFKWVEKKILVGAELKPEIGDKDIIELKYVQDWKNLMSILEKLIPDKNAIFLE